MRHDGTQKRKVLLPLLMEKLPLMEWKLQELIN